MKSDWGPTIGAVGMMLFLPICEEVRAYGFAKSSSSLKAPYHYYGPGLHWDPNISVAKNKWHKMFAAEKDLWALIASNSQEQIDSTDVAVIRGCVGEKSCSPTATTSTTTSTTSATTTWISTNIVATGAGLFAAATSVVVVLFVAAAWNRANRYRTRREPDSVHIELQEQRYRI